MPVTFGKGQEARTTLRTEQQQEKMRGILAQMTDPQERVDALMAAGMPEAAAKIQAVEQNRKVMQRGDVEFSQEQQDRSREEEENRLAVTGRVAKMMVSSLEGIEDPEQRAEVYKMLLPGAEAAIKEAGGVPRSMESLPWAALEEYSEEGVDALERIGTLSDAILGMKPGGEAFTLSPGQQRYDAQGNLIAASEDKPEAPQTDLGKLTTDLQNGLITQKQYDEQSKNIVEGVSEDDFKNENALRDEYNALSKSYFDVQGAHDRVLASVQDPTAAGDLALIFNYMKMLDPGSTVREGEFATAASSAGLPERLIAAAARVDSGKRLSDAQRDDFSDRAEKLWDAAKETHKTTKDRYTKLAKAYGLNPENVVSREEKPPVEGARKATDGEWYVPDPDRPGKYLMVGE